MKITQIVSLMVLLLCAGFSQAQEPATLADIQHRWAQINYAAIDDDARVEQFLALTKDAEELVKQAPDNADNHIWLGIVQSSTAGAKGGLSALKYAKAARKSLEHALKLDENALQGSAKTSLGVLYHKVPGWPIAFGSDKKAEQLLKAALSINPEGIDPNYFYAEFLYDDGEYQQSLAYLEKAMNAAPRPDRVLADAGRQREIETLKDKVSRKLN